MLLDDVLCDGMDLLQSHLLAVQRGHSVLHYCCFSSPLVELEPPLQLGNESSYVFALLQLLIPPSNIAYWRPYLRRNVPWTLSCIIEELDDLELAILLLVFG